jgi:uncharacterized protein (TIGR00730 family)
MRRICVFCGSSPGARPDYTAAAREVGAELVRRDLGLVYGGGSVGLMGILADSVLEAGGEVIGVIPDALGHLEVAHANLSDLRVVGSMHERKALMADLADGFIALPGGLGTLDEFFEIWTWAQLRIHDKPCGIINVRGYFDKLLPFLDHTVQERFVASTHRAMVMVETSPDVLLDRFRSYVPPTADKLLDREVR